jgi:hypothetical protein
VSIAHLTIRNQKSTPRTNTNTNERSQIGDKLT